MGAVATCGADGAAVKAIALVGRGPLSLTLSPADRGEGIGGGRGTGSGEQRSQATGPTEFAAPLLQTRKTGAREDSDVSEEPPRIRYLSQSGREDLNLRHPAPKFTRAAFQPV